MSSGGAMRIHPLAEKGPPSGTPSNCGAPSRERSQSVILARTRTASLPLFHTVMACVATLPGPACSSTRRGDDFDGDLGGGSGPGKRTSSRKQARNGPAQGAESVKTIVCV